MDGIRSEYKFENRDEFDNVCSALQHHLSYDDYNYKIEKWLSSFEIATREDCSDISKAVSICREQGGVYRNP